MSDKKERRRFDKALLDECIKRDGSCLDQTDYGEIRVKQISESNDFWCLFDELINDKSNFIYNRDVILDAYKDGNLYGLEIEETDSMFQRGAREDSLFCKDSMYLLHSMYLLPCFCIKDESTVHILWTHTRARKKGFAKQLIRELKILNIRNPLPESIGFWQKLGLL
jgi:hypothetical protein